MKNIIKIEFIKTWGYPGFRTLIILHSILFLLVVTIGSQINMSIQGLRIDKLFAFPNVWATFSWIGSWFNLLLGIIAISLVGNEHQFRTFRKQIIDGLSRTQILHGKMIVITVLAAYALALILLTGLVFGLFYSDSISFGSIFEKTPYVLVLFIQSFAYMMLGMLFAFVFKSNALSIVTFILFFFPIEPILRLFFPSVISQFFPIKIISNLTPMPDFLGITTSEMIQVNGRSPLSLQNLGVAQDALSVGASAFVGIMYIGLFYALCRIIIERRNY